ncbi:MULTISPECIES: TetR/AcrR family transcriptional regulator [unclassified Pseudofrankia]|uniref:TetR/AcrR family transcriptional regulator n=1 Tax=unclassified Pseudofrankia TaxID=2994372 RepID=UPI0018E3523D|nr:MULTISPECIES: TetR family transcriptional regulator [unclassified Pseudofrankia]MDT3442660.1 TetR family transcriptional regulator [Pseudofrankia sp. BMG5.37]
MNRRQGATIEPALVDATAAAISRWGLADVTLERVATQAGLSRATLHRRGVTRDALVDALTARAAEEFRAAVWPAITGPGTAAERLRAALDGLCAAADAHLELLAGLFLARGEVFHEPGPGTLTIDTFAGPFERLLRDGALDGSLRDVPPTVTATVLFNTAGWGYVHLRASHRWPAQRARTAVIDLVLRGLLVGESPGAADHKAAAIDVNDIG